MTENPAISPPYADLPAVQGSNGVSTPTAAPTAVSEPLLEWNPLAQVTTTRHPLKVSGGRAAVLLRKWSGRERLAYEDALTERMLTLDQAGDETVKIGTLRLYGVSLTVVGSEGFPPRADGTPMFTGDRELREADLLALEPETYTEVREAALEYQPLPSMGGDKKDDDDEADLEDPSRTPSTPRPVDGATAPGSPTG